MTKERWIIVGAAVAVAASVAAYRATRPATAVRLGLIQQLNDVQKRPSDPMPAEWCVAEEATLAGERRLAVAVLPNSRLTWKVTVPPHASLRAWIGLDQAAWDKEGDGVLFRIGVSDANGFRDLITRQVNPFAVPGDRHWVPVIIDLTPYSGLDVSLIFNTNASLPDHGNDTRNDRPLWGDPAIVTAR